MQDLTKFKKLIKKYEGKDDGYLCCYMEYWKQYFCPFIITPMGQIELELLTDLTVGKPDVTSKEDIYSLVKKTHRYVEAIKQESSEGLIQESYKVILKILREGPKTMTNLLMGMVCQGALMVEGGIYMKDLALTNIEIISRVLDQRKASKTAQDWLEKHR